MTPVNFNSYVDLVKGVQVQDFIPTSDRPNRGGYPSIMFEQTVGDKRVIIDSNYNIREERL